MRMRGDHSFHNSTLRIRVVEACRICLGTGRMRQKQMDWFTILEHQIESCLESDLKGEET